MIPDATHALNNEVYPLPCGNFISPAAAQTKFRAIFRDSEPQEIQKMQSMIFVQLNRENLPQCPAPIVIFYDITAKEITRRASIEWTPL